MVINKTIINNIENMRRTPIPNKLEKYLLVKYAQEPFPYVYSEQDLYVNIEKDIRAFESNSLDITIKPPSERWQEEREYLQQLCLEKYCETNELLEYVDELEGILSEHGLETVRMIKKRIALSNILY